MEKWACERYTVYTHFMVALWPCAFILSQEAVVQYEQYEQEVKNLQRLIEEAHRIIQDRPVSTNNIQELQAQIHHHEVRRNSLMHLLK